jgi:hypothetical protein
VDLEAERKSIVMATHTDVELLDEELAYAPPVGLSEPVINARTSYYGLLLDVCSADDQGSAALASALARATDEVRTSVLASSTLRAHLNARLRERKGEEVEVSPALLGALTERVDAGWPAKPFESPAAIPLLPEDPSVRTWLWIDSSDDVGAAELQRLYQTELRYGSDAKDVALRSPDERMQRMVESGIQLLALLMPSVSREMLAHVNLIAIVDYIDPRRRVGIERPDLFESGSNDSVPGVLFLSPNALRTSWNAAEAILHEACHQKVFDTACVDTVYREDYLSATSERITALWNVPTPENPIEWTVDRALIACHVYAHLAVFFCACGASRQVLEATYGELGAQSPERAFRRASDRAQYLGRQLLGPARHELGSSGRTWIQWLLDELWTKVDEEIEPSELVERLTPGEAFRS